MFGFKGSKKSVQTCSVCGKTIEPDVQVADLCRDCFNRCVLLSKQLEYLQNTSIDNLNIIQKAAVQAVSDAAPVIQGAPVYTEPVATDPETGNDTAVEETKVSYSIIRKSNNESYPVGSSLTIGSSEEKATISIPENRTLSRVHAQLKINGDGKCCLIDLGSRNGTKINGVRIEPNTEYVLEDGNVFSLASEIFRFVAG